jgi:hypothetical protein
MGRPGNLDVSPARDTAAYGPRMERFKQGSLAGFFFALGLYARDLWIELPSPDAAPELIEMIAVVLLMGTAFVIRRAFAPLLMFLALVAVWWFRSGTHHFFGYPADGFVRTWLVSIGAILAIGAAFVVSVNASTRRD